MVDQKPTYLSWVRRWSSTDTRFSTSVWSIHDRPMVAKNFENLVNELLCSNSPKKWFRAYFNHGLINYIYGQKRLLPCDMSFDTFFLEMLQLLLRCPKHPTLPWNGP